MRDLRDRFCRIFHHLSWPRQDEEGFYQVCLDDGRHVPWRDPLPLPSPYRKNDSPGGCLLTFKIKKEIALEPVQEPHARRAITNAPERRRVRPAPGDISPTPANRFGEPPRNHAFGFSLMEEES